MLSVLESHVHKRQRGFIVAIMWTSALDVLAQEAGTWCLRDSLAAQLAECSAVSNQPVSEPVHQNAAILAKLLAVDSHTGLWAKRRMGRSGKSLLSFGTGSQSSGVFLQFTPSANTTL